jgi:hypothetical protein
MNRTKVNIYLGITWIVTLAIAYMTGWWKGVKSVTAVATQTAESSFPFILVALALVALVSGYLALKARGYLSSRSETPSARPL